MKSREMRFLRVARRVAEALGPDECLLAGGLAVMVHGFVRGTRDVDLVTRLALAEARSRLERAGFATKLLRGDPFEGGFACLKGECDGLPFDVLPQLVPIHWDAAASVDAFEGSGLRAVALRDLLALKFKAQGAKDLMDAAMLVLLHPETEPNARELATAYRVLDRFEHWLADPRLHAQAREEARADGLASRRGAAPKKPRRKPSRRPR
jgi:hypothetical protein